LNESQYPTLHDFNEYLGRVVHWHITYLEFLNLPESRRRPTVGAFVRNPYDRAYSGFMQLQWDIQAQPHMSFRLPWVRELVLEQLAQHAARIAAADGDFDKWLASLKESEVYDVGKDSSFALHPCHYWTGIGGRNQIDFIGKVERYESDLQRFCDLVGVQQRKEAGSANVRFPEQAGAPNRPYKYADRMNRASIDKINALFERDIELFGYRRLGARSRRRNSTAFA
jgi:hypothetical protein